MSESGFFSSVKRDFVDIRKDEWPKALGLSLLFFLVIAIFWVLKPMKRGVILSYFGQEETLRLLGYTLSGAQAEQVGKVITMVVAYLMVILFTLLVRRLRRQYLVVVFCSAFAVLFLFYAARMDSLTAPIVWSFYVSGDIWTTLMVTTFWAFANDINAPGEARRIYGVVGLGGVVGGFVGATAVASLVERVGRPPLLLALVALLAGIVGLTFWIDRRTRRRSEERDQPCCPEREGRAEDADARPSGSAAIEGARLVFESR
ncbi:MAG: Npt1/Npt2 family nucleotide transporter, partial [Gemmatimonadota bacterium]|nr:Npt1/Npt2 family nucleotide transporter [Gemmatimonadota bacterium]